MEPSVPPAAGSEAVGDDPARHLDLLIEMMSAFARSRDIEAALRQGLVHAVARLEAEAGSLFLIDPESGALLCRASVGPVDVVGLRLAPGTGIVGRAVTTAQPQRIDAADRDRGFSPRVDAATGFVTRQILCVPLTAGTEQLGAVELFNKRGGQPFTVADQRLLQVLADSAALALVNARLLNELAEQESLRNDMALAAEVQRALLPAPPPADGPIHGVNLPARGVSGDFYEIVPLDDGRIAFAVGDVSGKGINAALLMARVASLFRCLARREPGPGRILAAIDAELHGAGLVGMFVTMAAGILDPATGQVVLANAGQEPPLLDAGGTARTIDGGAPPLGIDPALFADGCPEQTVALDGGALYLFSDGLTEARGTGGGMLGGPGVAALIDLFRAMPAAERVRLVSRVIDGMGPRIDDITLLVVEDRRAAPSAAIQALFPARPEALAEIRRRVAAAATELGAPPLAVEDCVLATDEGCQNIIRHGYLGGEGEIVVHVGRSGDTLTVRLIDFAPPVDVAKIRPRSLDDLRPGGLGTHLMRSVMDTVVFRPPPAGIGNLLEMTRRIGAS